MIILRRSSQRRHERTRHRDTWLSFDPWKLEDPLAEGFGTLELLNEHRLRPGADLPPYPHSRDAEIVVSIREGTLAYRDPYARLGVISAGEIAHMTVGPGTRRNGTNASRTYWAHVFEIGFRPNLAELRPGHERKRISAAERKGVLCVVASPDGCKGSLRIHQDVLIYSSILEPGKHVVLELKPGRSAWLHLIQGEVSFSEFILTTGDGVGVIQERAVSLTAVEPSEILLFEMGAPLPWDLMKGAVP